jgi:hypothetical protein
VEITTNPQHLAELKTALETEMSESLKFVKKTNALKYEIFYAKGGKFFKNVKFHREKYLSFYEFDGVRIQNGLFILLLCRSNLIFRRFLTRFFFEENLLQVNQSQLSYELIRAIIHLVSFLYFSRLP